MPRSINDTMPDQGRSLRMVVVILGTTCILLFAYLQWSTATVFALIGMGAMLFSFVRKIRVGLLTLLILKPVIDVAWDVNLFAIGSVSINVLKLTGFLIPLLCVMFLLTTRKSLMISRLNIGVLLFIAANVISVMIYLANTFDPGRTLFSISIHVLRILNGALIYLIVPLVFDEPDDQWLLIRTMFYSTLFPSVLSTLTYFTGQANITIGQEVERFAGIYHDPGGMSITAFIGLTSSLLYLSTDHPRNPKHPMTKIMILAMVLINVWLLYITYTRMMYVVTLVFLGLWITIRYRKGLLVLLATPLLVFGLITTEEFQQRNWKEIKAYEAYQNRENSDFFLQYSGGGRVMVWSNAIDMIEEYDLSQLALGTGRLMPLHNEYLDLLVRTGLVGLMIFLFMITSLGAYLWRRYRTHENEMAGTVALFSLLLIVSFAIMGLTGYTVSQTTFGIYMWSMVAIALYYQPARKPA